MRILKELILQKDIAREIRGLCEDYSQPSLQFKLVLKKISLGNRYQLLVYGDWLVRELEFLAVLKSKNYIQI